MHQQQFSQTYKKIRALSALLTNFLGKYFIFFAPALLFVMVSAGFVFIVNPKYEQIALQIEATKNSRTEEIKSIQAYLGELNKYNSFYGDFSDLEKEKVNKLLPTAAGAEDLLAEINYILSKKGVLVQSITASGGSQSSGQRAKISLAGGAKTEARPENDIAEISLSVSVIGVDYSLLKDILNTFENYLRIMDVQSLAFSPDNQSLSLDIKTYYLKTAQ